MKLGLVATVLLLGMSSAGTPQEGAGTLCEGGQNFFMQEIERPDVDYSMLSVAPAEDRHYFIRTPPLPDLSNRICHLDWLEEFVPDGPPRWFEPGH